MNRPIEQIEAFGPALSAIARELTSAHRLVAQRRLTDRTPSGKQALLAALDEVRRHAADAAKLGGTVKAFTPVRIEFRGTRDGRPVRVTWVDGARPRFVWREEDRRASRPASGTWFDVLGKDLGLQVA